VTRDRRGFTLLELIVAAALVGAASIVVAGAFAAGLKIFERARQFGGYGESVVALELIQKDLHNVAPFRLGKFQGGRTWIEIPLVVRRPGRVEEGDPLGRVRYEAGLDGHSLDRVTTVYVLPDRPEEVREAVITVMEGVSFAYGSTGPDGTSPVSWAEEWTNPTNLPAVVRIMMGSKQNGERLESTRLVMLPRR
jgi:prepilin-type N-terminal cleavage/methylation domain-containing protein